MSEFIAHDTQEELKRIIKQLHDGASVKDVKKDFHQLIQGVSPEEIASMEQSLMDEGFPAEEVQRLCDVHVEVFESSLNKQKTPKNLPGHPVHTFKLENKNVIGKLKQCKKIAKQLMHKQSPELQKELLTAIQDVKLYARHFERKENQLFPYLEKYQFIGPSKVMWGKHDEIRSVWRKLEKDLELRDAAELLHQIKDLTARIKKMIFMEEKILYPTALKKLSEKDWAHIRNGEAEIGYAWIKPGNVWDAGIVLSKGMRDTVASWSQVKKGDTEKTADTKIPLTVGALSPEQLNLLLLNLPLDITFVDENDKVCYYTGSEHRVFPRSPAIIGRDVQNCHPHKSVDIVEKILETFKNKEKNKAEFWIQMGDMFVHIQYFALYDDAGSYKGCIEVSQDVADIRALEGERRLLDW